MSANPFRRSMHQLPATTSAPRAAASSSGAGGPAFSSVEDVQPAPAAAARTKKVRLASPPPSPPQPSSLALDQDLVGRLNIAHHAGSPPPSAGFDDDSASSTVEASADFCDPDLPGKGQDTENESVGLTSPGIPAQMGTGSTSSNIPNPFSRTLATIEPPPARAPPMTEDTTSPPVRPAFGRAGSDKMRASMDVDAFTKMLMTGNAGPAASGALNRNGQQKAGFGIAADSSSNTDASSASKQSIFEAHHGAYQESPRSSYEQSVSDDDDRSRLVEAGEPQKTQKKKPPPPKHKHGKPMQPRGPQVVSFNDFEDSFSLPMASQPPGPQITGSDMNKALPVRPRGSTPGATPREKDLPSAPSQESPQSNRPDESSRRRAPPPPPATRRQSAMKTALSSASRSRSTSNATTSSQPEDSTEHTTPTPYSLPKDTLTSVPSSTPHSKPPPPPPTRRSHASSHASDNASLPSRSNSRKSAILPPAEYIRTPSTTSLHTLGKTPKQRPLSMPPGALAQNFNAYTTAQAHPPPPPPRRASSKSSFDMPRGAASSAERRATSGETRQPRRPSGASGNSVGSAPRGYDVVEEGEGEVGAAGVVGGRGVTAEPEEMPGRGTAGERDILGEMDSFAREVEALRSQYRGVGR